MHVNRFGIDVLETIEDAIQWSMLQALDTWSTQDVPDNTAAWLYKVSLRRLISELKSEKRRQAILDEQVPPVDEYIANEETLSNEMGCAMLRMLFTACHPSIPIESQLVFTLKSLCGFSVREVSIRLFISEANVYKRFNRAKKFLKADIKTIDSVAADQLENRIESVYKVIYLIFTEGYLSSDADYSIRQDLCEEALRLGLFLRDSEIGCKGKTHALLALIYLNLARLPARQHTSGALTLLEQQDRRLWDKSLITHGVSYLRLSTSSDDISRYHIEAGIAAEHCLSPSFKETRWQKIIASYELLEKISPSPLHVLNKALAIAEHDSPSQALDVLASYDFPKWLAQSYHWYAVLADLHARDGNISVSAKNADLAIEKAPTDTIRSLLRQRLIRSKD
ncbi:RNA polymerase sigma factor [Agaribacter marinus]|uniref:DNA-directed RNA polymerase sigma-70 factor n=1 Tax=Agaribacter marinus TaxID=1431249 RepID=A0AA37WH36_9ALTE|nr:DUF6596 domain-containing protein [Agaribacter marinus]GLR69528.1 DNA-directed RNA polymerase sigma-70 factor [Agaribacter marinus]